MVHTSTPQQDLYKEGVWRVPHLAGRVAISSNRRIIFIWVSDILSIQRTSSETRLDVRNGADNKGYISYSLTIDLLKFIPILGSSFPLIQKTRLVNIGKVESIGHYCINVEYLGQVIVDHEYWESLIKVVDFFGFTSRVKKSARLFEIQKYKNRKEVWPMQSSKIN